MENQHHHSRTELSKEAALELRLAELEADLASYKSENQALRQENEMLRAVIDRLPYAIYWKDPELNYLGCNLRFAIDVGFASPQGIAGKTDYDLPWQPGEAEIFRQKEHDILTSQMPDYIDETVEYDDGSREWFETYKYPLYNEAGSVIGLLSTYNNITARKQAEATVQAQATLLEELSTPVIPLTDQILVVPIVGTLDNARANQLFNNVLEQVAHWKAKTLILDITGVPWIDTEVSQIVINIGQAVKLLGAKVVVTGIRAEVAMSLVGLGVDLSSMDSYSNLQQAVKEVFFRTHS
jgi:rsbT co-antagonist protein RsbR